MNDPAFAELFHDPVRLGRAVVWPRPNDTDKALQELVALRDPQQWENWEAAQVRGLAADLKNDQYGACSAFEQADRAGCLPEGSRLFME